ncbi:hypothetical protein IFR04_011828 [Cadophora malorum]|uniref:Uncharacterized protein n=1 Tax=Cadophora malorum TaxID=108018 RepID=A0A8H7TA30_9HELO|nr:hypothetical protein IFR04_011828 [Cadophora malorum]
MAKPQHNQQVAQQPNTPPNHPLFPRVAGNLQIDAVTNASMAFGALPVTPNGTIQDRELYQRHVLRNIDFRNPNSNQADIHRH